MFAEQEFLADYERFDRQNYRSFDRKFAMKELLKLALPLDGDLAECGVFRGASSYLLAKAIAAEAPAKQLHLFTRLPGSRNPSPPVTARTGGPATLLAILPRLPPIWRSMRVASSSIRVGFPINLRTLTRRNPALSILTSTCTSRPATRWAFFGERLMPGGILICDDYGFETCPGARLAMDEYAGAVRKPVVHLPTGQGIIF